MGKTLQKSVSELNEASSSLFDVMINSLKKSCKKPKEYKEYNVSIMPRYLNIPQIPRKEKYIQLEKILNDVEKYSNQGDKDTTIKLLEAAKEKIDLMIKQAKK